jgi:F-type H+-transporting ATPase subunit epsilon
VGEQGGPADADRRLFVEGGFVEVAHDQVTVITQRALPVEKVDVAAARADLAKASGEVAAGDEAIDAKLRAVQTARALVRAAEARR